MAVDPVQHAGGPDDRAAGVRVQRLFEEHSRMVYGLCRALLRDPHDAEDATQAVFVSAYRALLGGTKPREPGAWLATIARNECSARAQARMREPLPVPEDALDHGHLAGPESELERRTAVAGIRAAIADLPEKQREAVVLRDLYGLPYTEVGIALGMSVASVESLLFRARRTLRVSLKPLAGGALTVPVAVREGVAQAIPSFSEAGVAAGGAAGGAVGLGILAKLASGPAGVKVAAGVAAALAAGSAAVVKVERTRAPEAPAPPAAQAPGQGGAAEASGAPGPFTVAPVALAASRSSGDDRKASEADDRGGKASGGERSRAHEDRAVEGDDTETGTSGSYASGASRDEGSRADGSQGKGSSDDGASGHASSGRGSSGADSAGHDETLDHSGTSDQSGSGGDDGDRSGETSGSDSGSSGTGGDDSNGPGGSDGSSDDGHGGDSGGGGSGGSGSGGGYSGGGGDDEHATTVSPA